MSLINAGSNALDDLEELRPNLEVAISCAEAAREIPEAQRARRIGEQALMYYRELEQCLLALYGEAHRRSDEAAEAARAAKAEKAREDARERRRLAE